MVIEKTITEKFADFVFDWNYETYLALGGYGSGKSYQIAEKIIFKLLQEKRKCLVVREVYGTIQESCFDLIREVLEGMNLLVDGSANNVSKAYKVYYKKSPLEFVFPNGSRIIFRGMDSPLKMKSINDISIVWLEECSEIKYDGYKELLGRLRTPNVSIHFLLSCNPVGKENWVYRHFFVNLTDEGKEIIKVDEEEFYKRGSIISNGTYYHHSLPDDNPFLPASYIKRLDGLKEYDYPLWRVARQGRFGAAGTRVLPQFEIAKDAKEFKEKIKAIPEVNKKIGFDFGFETSYNAVVKMAVDQAESILYIYDEIYINKITDDKFAMLPEMQQIKNSEKQIVADNEDPKAIAYYRQVGFKIRACRNKFAGSRLSNTRKVKRFKKIICSPKCINVIRELKELTYKKDSKGNVIYDDFNIDPHTFSAIWYGLDTITVADIKEEKRNSIRGKG